ncbi:hypothetical protein RHS01_03703 [Rhizoctonia solani]|uniref:Uncharacterized protein n=1 Tax=Rhizoctonia solani TaxID=456999 RepID=A0A8H7M342_9AGAM|nr:hypothetical protein RHS01_03703 [Rhizoctonia solani]
MIPYYAYKKYKQNQALKEAALDKKDEQFLSEAIERSPLRRNLQLQPPQSTVFLKKTSLTGAKRKKGNQSLGHRLSKGGGLLAGQVQVTVYRRSSQSDTLPTPSISQPATPGEAHKPLTLNDPTANPPHMNLMTKEQKDLAEVLDSLNMQAGQQGIAFTTPDTKALLQQFTQIIKDLVNGVPTAYNDLIEVRPSLTVGLASFFVSEINPVATTWNTPDVFAAMTAAAAAPTTGDQSQAETAPKSSAGPGSKFNPMSFFTKTNPKTGTKSRTLPGPGQTRFPLLAGTNALMSMGISSKFDTQGWEGGSPSKEAEDAKLEAKDAPELVKDAGDEDPKPSTDSKGT